MSSIDEAVNILKENIESIQTVPDWATMMGFKSSDYFSRKVRNHFGSRPKELIIKNKLCCLCDYLQESPEDIYYCVACKLGFADENALYKFVKRHTGQSLNEFKESVCDKESMLEVID